MRATRSEIWSRYWEYGQPHSCPGSLDDRLGGDFERFWRDAAGPLVTSDRVLEIGAGNGALSRLIIERFFDDHPPIMDAIDLAEVSPTWIKTLEPLRRQRVRFHGRTAIEKLPFEASTFSLVVGQYAFEYAEQTLALAEIVRCSRPDARLVLVLHHAQSEVIRIAKAEQQHLRWLLAPDGLYQAAFALVSDLVQARVPHGVERLTQNAAAESRRQRYNALQNELQVLASAGTAPDVLQEAAQGVARALEAVLLEGEDSARILLRQQSLMLSDSKQRLDELIDCALDDDDLTQLKGKLKEIGYNKVETGTIQAQGNLMGWTLIATRAGLTLT